MADALMARCGFYCGPCQCREDMGCPGCQAVEGKPFWGECGVAKCSIEKGYEHCGQCPEAPCTMLTECAYQPEHGDHGKRLLNLGAWNAIGFEAWLRDKNKPS